MTLRDLIERRTLWIGGCVGLAVSGVGLGVYAMRNPAPSLRDSEPVHNARIERVYSGHLIKSEKGQKIVYTGIRAPYENERYFEEAKARNAQLVGGRKIRLRFDEKRWDRKDRLCAYVFAKGQMVNETLVREGLAYVRLTPWTTRFADRLLEAQADARAAKKGIWKRPPKTTEKAYLADLKYGNFHRMTCPEVPNIKPERRVHLDKRSSAFDRGLAPCVKCSP